MTENPQPGQPPVGDPNIPPPAPTYGTPAPTYGTPAPTYGTPPTQGYGAPPPSGYPAPAPGYSSPVASGGVSESDARMWAMLGHLGAIILGFIAPLIVWAMYKDRNEFVKDQSTEALNFQITVAIAWVVAIVLSAVVIGFILFPVIWIGNLVLCIMGGMAANRGERYRYPFALRLVK